MNSFESAGTDSPKELTQQAMDLLLKPMQKLSVLRHACSSDLGPIDRDELEAFVEDIYHDVSQARGLVDLANLASLRI